MNSEDSITPPDEDHQAPDPASQRWFLIPLAVLALGVGSIGLLILTDWMRERMVRQDTAVHRAVGEIQTRLSTAHLWLEEYVTGDEVDLEEISPSLDRAQALIDAMLSGGQAGPYRIEAITDADLLDRVRPMAGRIEAFAELSRVRESGYLAGESVGIGSEIDGRYDAAYNLLLSDLRELDAEVALRLNEANARSKLIFRAILIAWIAIVVLAVTGLTQLEIHRRKAQQALRESEAQLRQAQKMEAVGRLAGGMAHDINNYLAAITAQCELVLMGAEKESVLGQRMGSVVATTTKAAALIERLLAFSRRKPVQPEVINLNHVVKDLSVLLERLIGEDIELEVVSTDELWNVEIDPSQAEQVLLNLVVNAREAMPTGGRLVVETDNHRVKGDYPESLPVADGDYVVLSVADTGTGVAEEVREILFEPFVTTKNQTHQSGLGLAMVYAIATQSGGGVTLYSSPGHGATFRVYLPRSRAIPLAAGAPDVVQAEIGGGQRLLMVEDNAELRQATSEALRNLGYHVDVAGSGEEALEVVSALEHQPELLITDVVMPGMSGRELWNRLREEQPDLDVVFISGHTDDVVLRHGVEEGEYRFLQKPFSLESLASSVAAALANRR